jgi:hypothetical protein
MPRNRENSKNRERKNKAHNPNTSDQHFDNAPQLPLETKLDLQRKTEIKTSHQPLPQVEEDEVEDDIFFF